MYLMSPPGVVASAPTGWSLVKGSVCARVLIAVLLLLREGLPPMTPCVRSLGVDSPASVRAPVRATVSFPQKRRLSGTRDPDRD